MESLADKLRRADGSAELEALRAEVEVLKAKLSDWQDAGISVGITCPGAMQQAKHLADAACEALNLDYSNTSPLDIRAKLAASEAFSEGWRDENLRLNAAREREMSETIAKLAESESAAAAMRKELAWAVGYMNAESVMSGMKRGDNSAIDGHLDWIQRANAALATDVGKSNPDYDTIPS